MTPDPPSVALVTGAGRGLGAAIVRELAVAGKVVVACDIDHAAVVELAADLSQIGLACEPQPVDVADVDEVQRVVDATVAQFGQIDVLVNNAGVGAVAASEDMPRGCGTVVRFLVSDEASFVTGAAVDVDWGWLSYGGW